MDAPLWGEILMNWFHRKLTSLHKYKNVVFLCYKYGGYIFRPSGTEDVVRVYAESDTQANTDQLAYEVGVKVYELAGGVGDPVKKLWYCELKLPTPMSIQCASNALHQRSA